MNISSVAAAVSTQSQTAVQGQAQLLVMKKAMDLQEANALQLLQALPQPVQAATGSSLGTVVNTFA